MSTPAVRLEPATLLRRFAAFCYDLLLLVALVASFTLVVVAIRGGQAVRPGTVWFELALGLIVVLFFCGFWIHGGQTLGMRAWRLRVLRDDGARLSWPQALVRLGVAWLGALALGLGYWSSWFDAARRCWHDRASGTHVVRERPAGS
jgi:uncharacterized RDD family membrane protein YckC